MTDSQLPLLDPDYAEPVDLSTQVTRLPGTVNADCLCGRDSGCLWPFCTFNKEDA